MKHDLNLIKAGLTFKCFVSINRVHFECSTSDGKRKEKQKEG